MADVTLESTEEIIQLVSVSGASTADITAAVAVETAARQAADAAHAILTTGIHGVGVSTIASAASVSSAVATHAALTTGVHGLSANDSLVSNIVGWQSIAAPLKIGGISIGSWGTINNSLSTVTTISGVVQDRIRQHGFVIGVKFYVYSVDGGYVIFRVFRPNGANYDYVGESEPITLPTVIGTMTARFISPIPCQPGDVVGVYCPAPADIGIGAGVVTAGVRYAAGNIQSSNAFATTVDNYYLTIEAVGVAPYVAFTGDSIMEGQLTWESFYDDGPAGTLAHEPGYQLRLLTQDYILPYQNHCKGAQTFAWVFSTGAVSALATGAKYIWVHAGVNDVQAGRTWAAVLSDLDAIKVLFDAANTTGSRKLLIDEILPWTAGTDGNAATIRTFNTNLAAWCTANNATLVVCHDAMGQVRGSTGELDDLITAYDADGVHLTQAGIVALAALLEPYLT